MTNNMSMFTRYNVYLVQLILVCLHDDICKELDTLKSWPDDIYGKLREHQSYSNSSCGYCDISDWHCRHTAAGMQSPYFAFLPGEPGQDVRSDESFRATCGFKNDYFILFNCLCPFLKITRAIENGAAAGAHTFPPLRETQKMDVGVFFWNSLMSVRERSPRLWILTPQLTFTISVWDPWKHFQGFHISFNLFNCVLLHKLLCYHSTVLIITLGTLPPTHLSLEYLIMYFQCTEFHIPFRPQCTVRWCQEDGNKSLISSVTTVTTKNQPHNTGFSETHWL